MHKVQAHFCLKYIYTNDNLGREKGSLRKYF